jgi:predicted nucleic acid-binding protein
MSGADSFFVDTSVLLYSVDSASAEKHAIAREWLGRLWETGSGRLSWQVLHEFYVNALCRLKLPPRFARETVTLFSTWHPVDTSPALVERAWYWIDEAKVSYWEALIVAAAERSGATVLLTEDLHDGRRFDGLVAVNPFGLNPMQIP